MGPKEDPESKKARETERRQAILERRHAAEANARGLTTDLNAVYGTGGLSLFGSKGAKK